MKTGEVDANSKGLCVCSCDGLRLKMGLRCRYALAHEPL